MQAMTRAAVVLIGVVLLGEDSAAAEPFLETGISVFNNGVLLRSERNQGLRSHDPRS